MIGLDEAEMLRARLLDLAENRRVNREDATLVEVLLDRLNRDDGRPAMSDGELRRQQVVESIGYLSTLALEADRESLQGMLDELGQLCEARFDDARIDLLSLADGFSLRAELPERDLDKRLLSETVRLVVGFTNNEFESIEGLDGG